MNVTGVKTVKSLPKMPQQQQTNFNLSTKVISGKKLQLSKKLLKKQKAENFGAFFPNSQWVFFSLLR